MMIRRDCLFILLIYLFEHFEHFFFCSNDVYLDNVFYVFPLLLFLQSLLCMIGDYEFYFIFLLSLVFSCTWLRLSLMLEC